MPSSKASYMLTTAQLHTRGNFIHQRCSHVTLSKTQDNRPLIVLQPVYEWQAPDRADLMRTKLTLPMNYVSQIPIYYAGPLALFLDQLDFHFKIINF